MNMMKDIHERESESFAEQRKQVDMMMKLASTATSEQPANPKKRERPDDEPTPQKTNKLRVVTRSHKRPRIIDNSDEELSSEDGVDESSADDEHPAWVTGDADADTHKCLVVNNAAKTKIRVRLYWKGGANADAVGVLFKNGSVMFHEQNDNVPVKSIHALGKSYTRQVAALARKIRQRLIKSNLSASGGEIARYLQDHFEDFIEIVRHLTCHRVTGKFIMEFGV